MADFSMGTYVVELSLEDCNMRVEDLDPQLFNNDRMHYQRNRIESNVKRIMKKYESDSAKHAIIAQREDGSYWVINGQHHSEAAIRLGITSVPCYVFDSNGFEHEREIFVKFQEWQKELDDD